MSHRTLLAAFTGLALAAFAPATAHAATACGDLSAASAQAAGERFMERMLGSAEAHRAMDRTMAAMMGADGMRQAHEMMGRSAHGCPAGAAPARMTQMMGAMGAMAGMMGGESPYYDGMMRRGSGMMGAAGGDHDGWNAVDTIMVALMALLVAAALTALVMFARRGGVRPPGAAGPTSHTPGST